MRWANLVAQVRWVRQVVRTHDSGVGAVVVLAGVGGCLGGEGASVVTLEMCHSDFQGEEVMQHHTFVASSFVGEARVGADVAATAYCSYDVVVLLLPLLLPVVSSPPPSSSVLDLSFQSAASSCSIQH